MLNQARVCFFKFKLALYTCILDMSNDQARVCFFRIQISPKFGINLKLGLSSSGTLQHSRMRSYRSLKEDLF